MVASLSLLTFATSPTTFLNAPWKMPKRSDFLKLTVLPSVKTTEGWNTPKYSLNRWPLLKVHHWAIILRFFVLGVFMCGPVFCPCLSVSVYICLCLLCALCLFVFIVFMCWSSLHMVANFRRCWKVQRQQLCLGTLPTWGSAQPRCKVNSFNFLHPSFRRN